MYFNVLPLLSEGCNVAMHCNVLPFCLKAVMLQRCYVAIYYNVLPELSLLLGQKAVYVATYCELGKQTQRLNLAVCGNSESAPDQTSQTL
jgi:hypothetical protein